MSTSQPVAVRRRSRAWTILAVLAAVGVLLALTPAVVEKIAGRSIGALMNESQGNSVFNRYDDATEIPQGDRPSWLPADAHDIQVVGSGPNSGEEGVRLDAEVASAPVPSECVPAESRSIPWDGGGNWPDLASATTYSCDPSWTLAVTGDRWYVWG